MATGQAGTGGWHPGFVRTELGPDEEVSFLASEHLMAKRVGITIDSTTVPANANGDRILRAGTVMALIESTGKYRPYDPALQNNAGGEAAGFLMESVNCRDGDVIAGMLIHGSVIASRVSGLDSSGRADMANRIIFQ